MSARYICKLCAAESPTGIGYADSSIGPLPAPAEDCPNLHRPPVAPAGCSCAFNTDGSVTTFLCPVHAETDPCWTMASVTGRRRKGTIRRGVCTACGHSSRRSES